MESKRYIAPNIIPVATAYFDVLTNYTLNNVFMQSFKITSEIGGINNNPEIKYAYYPPYL